jgi:hypothetical protein
VDGPYDYPGSSLKQKWTGRNLPQKRKKAIYLFFEWVISRVRASPDAARTSIQVTREPMAAAVSQDARRLVRQVLGWVDYLCLQANLLINVLAILHFQGFPGLFGHFHLR